METRASSAWVVWLSVLASATVFSIFGYQSGAYAADASQACIAIEDAAARLACYDQAHANDGPPRAPQSEQAIPEPEEPDSEEMAGAPSATARTSLASIWELDDEHKRGTFRLLPYRANYLLPFRYSDRPNTSPGSPAANRSVDDLPLSATEAKFQLSVKFKVWENLFGDNGDVWFGYTQQSNWQLYNSNRVVSGAFRETDYEPEAILALRTEADVLGWRWRMLNLGFVHQSNGRALPLSRSWNRVYAEFGLERGEFALLVRPWIRLPEKSDDDDNPDIRHYMGSGDARLIYARAGHVYSVLGRYSPSEGHGAVQFDWAFPIAGALKGYVQLFSGYGESLIDYNHAQTTLGIGLLLVPWQ